MVRGLPASILFHAALVVGGSLAWPYISTPLESSYVAVPIEILELGDIASQRPQVERDPEEPPEEEPPQVPEEDFFEEPEDAEPAEEEDLPPEEMLASEEAPPPPPEEEETVSISEETEEPEAAEEEEDPEPEPPEEEPLIQETDPLDDILDFAEDTFDQDLLDKTPREERRTAQPRPELTDEQPEEAPSQAQLGVGDRARNQQSVVNIIYTQMSVCWDDVDDLPNPERLNVTVRMTLERDGTLKEDVKLVTPSRPPIGDRPMQVAIERALRAVRKCAPYRLPEDALASYDDWDEVTLNIGPAYKR
ncbi:MAG: hypothetical protein AAF253_03255 [Pseudomonadota bacterium]